MNHGPCFQQDQPVMSHRNQSHSFGDELHATTLYTVAAMNILQTVVWVAAGGRSNRGRCKQLTQHRAAQLGEHAAGEQLLAGNAVQHLHVQKLPAGAPALLLTLLLHFIFLCTVVCVSKTCMLQHSATAMCKYVIGVCVSSVKEGFCVMCISLDGHCEASASVCAVTHHQLQF